jgi:MauM/NapG family ferredoxin protein
LTSRATGADLRRRHLLSGALAGLAMVPALRVDGMLKRDNSGRLIRPPGAIPETQFSARCIACGACMKACPTNTLQPCTLGDGFGRMFTPKVVPRIAGCEDTCYVCGHVCPTKAIRALTPGQKSFAKIGTAVIDRHRCLAWEQNKQCLVCDEVCPYNAIEPRMVETTTGLFRVPVVDESLCIGCGMCEQHCPIDDTAAIVVYRFGENRIDHGDYVSSWQKEQILERRRRSDSASIGAAMPSGSVPAVGGEITGGLPPGYGQSSAADSGGLPPGFVQ